MKWRSDKILANCARMRIEFLGRRRNRSNPLAGNLISKTISCPLFVFIQFKWNVFADFCEHFIFQFGSFTFLKYEMKISS